MCGICGAVGEIDKRIIGQMNDAITHRGPDEDGYYLADNIMLGMRRLKVIDLHTGSQPKFNEDKSLVVVFNGEIYNYPSLRKELEEKGHVFDSSSDTETIVHLYEEYGDKLFNKLEGMFAIALWDSAKSRLLLGRDRVGIKPLYYYQSKETFLFASEIKSLLVCPQVAKDINYNGLHSYLTYQYIPAPETIFKGLSKLMPGHFLVVEKNALSMVQYWDIDDGDFNFQTTAGQTEYEIIDQLDGLLKEAVKKHLISDVPLGVFLSGGLDSGTLVALSSELLGRQVKTFSIGVEDPVLNELDNARLVAEQYGTDHHEFVVTPSDIDILEDILSFFDEPFADSSAIPTYFVSQSAKKYVTVALSGDGGDELFGGYGNYKADKIIAYLRKVPSSIRSLVQTTINCCQGEGDNYSFQRQIDKLLVAANLSGRDGHIFWLNVFDILQKKQLYSDPSLRDLLNKDPKVHAYQYFDKFLSDDFLNTCIKVDIKTVLPDDYLTKVDRMSMANSLEVRVPFLDHKLLEFAANLPSSVKLKRLTSKYIMKKLMKERLPSAIVSGKKKGFSIPLNRWFKQGFGALIDKYLSKEAVQMRGYFDYKYIANLSAEHVYGVKDNSKFLWALVCLEIWHRRYID